MSITKHIKLVKLSDIKPYKNNAKIHTPEQIESIKKSIEKHEYIQPICVDKNNEIVIGHGRYEAIKLINPDQQIEVMDLHYLDDKTIKKLRILDNKTISEEWDMEALQAEIEDIYGGLDDIDTIAGELNINIDELGIITDEMNKQNELEINESYEVIIECDSENNQEKVYNKISEMGYKCRLLTS